MAVDTRYVTHSAWTGLTSTQLTYPSGRQVSSGYDALYRRNSITETSGGASIANWQFFGQRTATVGLGNGVVTSFMNNAQTSSAVRSGDTPPAWGSITTDHLGYDGAGRLIGKRHFNSSSGGVIVGNTTAYDMSSNKLFERALHAESRSFLYDQYDSMDRLLDYQRGVLASGGGSVSTAISLPGTNQQQTYDLDALGNWSSTDITLEGADDSITQSRTHNKLNEVTAYGVSPTSTPVLYDQGNNSGTPPKKGNGNIIDDGVRLYAYDALNRLSTVKSKSSGNTIATYSYDAMGRRTRKVVTNGGLTGTVANSTFRYTYNNQQIAEELDGSNSTTRQFVWGQYIDELIQMKTHVSTGSQPLAAGTHYLLSDLLYRSVTLTSTPTGGATAAIVEAYDTDAYGNTLVYSAGGGTGGAWFSDADTTSVQPACETIFTGREYDPETQIYFYRARYYHPMLGRFIGRDPIGYRGSANLYTYARGATLTLVDPSGETERHVGPISSPLLPPVFPGVPVVTAPPLLSTELWDFLLGLGATGDVTYLSDPGTSISGMAWNQELGWAKDWLENGAKKFCCCNGGVDNSTYWSGLHRVTYTATKTDFLKDVVSLLLGGGADGYSLPDIRIQWIGSFILDYQCWIDCASNEVHFHGVIYNSWTVQSLTRNPITRQPIYNGKLRSVNQEIVIDKEGPAC
jgi:RHS repeat-associated protein